MKQLKSSRTYNRSTDTILQVGNKDKFQNQLALNKKLQQLFHTVKNNTHAKKLQHSQNNSLLVNAQKIKLKKLKECLKGQVSHLADRYNTILSQNKKLKEQANNRRKQRVIYSNIFKKFQKDIRLWEDAYQSTLLQSLTIKDSSKKVIQKLEFAKKKLLKQIKKHQKQSIRVIKLMQTNQNTFEVEQIGLVETQKLQKSGKKTQQKYQKNLEKDYEQEAKSIFYQNFLNRLVKITNLQSPIEIKEFLQSLDNTIEQALDNYTFLQNQNENLISEIRNQNRTLTMKLKQNQSQSTIQQIKQQIKKQENILRLNCDINLVQGKCKTLQKIILEKIDLNCQNLTNQEIVQYIKHFINKQNLNNGDNLKN